jgi:hypothetical protein
MIQFNLLPDVKLEYIRARYRKRMIVGVSVITGALFFSIFLVLFLFVRVSQTHYMKALSKDIDNKLSEIKQTPDLDKVLTIQNQLDSLPSLHDKKVITSRLVEFLGQLTPTLATISDVELDYDAGTMNIKGNANSLETVNKFADTLKFTKYRTATDPIGENKAFKDVVLKSFSIETLANGTGKSVVYELSFGFEPLVDKDNTALAPNIFAVKLNVKDDKITNPAKPVELIVPNIISTRSETEKPTELFAKQPETLNQEGNQ